MAAATAKYYFRFRICWCHWFQKVKMHQKTNFFRHISVDSWDITTTVFEKQTSAILDIYFRFRFRPLAEIYALFWIRLPNFVQIGAPTAEIWRHIHFSTWRPQPLYTTSGFVFVDVTAFKRSKSISRPNTSRYLSWRLRYNYFRFLKYKRQPYWNSTSGFDFDQFAVTCMLFCIRLPNFVEI